jgi:hypothetical protein
MLMAPLSDLEETDPEFIGSQPGIDRFTFHSQDAEDTLVASDWRVAVGSNLFEKARLRAIVGAGGQNDANR